LHIKVIQYIYYYKITFSEPQQHSSSSHQQLGRGSEQKSKRFEIDLDDSNEFYNTLATKVAEKISSKSSFTNLWKPSTISTPTVLSLSTPSTAPPVHYENKIQKLDENDDFGMK
jgi:hypothetical protein